MGGGEGGGDLKHVQRGLAEKLRVQPSFRVGKSEPCIGWCLGRSVLGRENSNAKALRQGCGCAVGRPSRKLGWPEWGE